MREQYCKRSHSLGTKHAVCQSIFLLLKATLNISDNVLNLLFMCMCPCVDMCLWAQYLQRPKEGVVSPGAGVTHELPNVGSSPTLSILAYKLSPCLLDTKCQISTILLINNLKKKSPFTHHPPWKRYLQLTINVILKHRVGTIANSSPWLTS